MPLWDGKQKNIYRKLDDFDKKLLIKNKEKK